MPTLHLTEASVRDVAFVAPGATLRQVLYRDGGKNRQPGFGLLVGATAKTFVANGRVKGGPERRVTIGRWPTWKVDAARERARELITAMDRGVDPNRAAREAAARGITLEDAADLHRAVMRHKKNAEGTFRNFDAALKMHLSDWLKRPLADISKADAARRHDRITRSHGPVAANTAMKALRQSYNTARKTHDRLPADNPVMGVTFNKEKPRREPIAERDLPAWYEKIVALRERNPIRADYQELVLFTGLRRRDAATIKWDDVDLEARALYRPKPKGGEDRAFAIPLSEHAVKILKRRKAENEKVFPKPEWVFPADSESGHVEEPKEYRTIKREDGTKERALHLPSPHRLRDTYSTAAASCGLNEYTVDMLTNHRPTTGRVGRGYVGAEVDPLRAAQERVSAYLLSKLAPPPTGDVVPMATARAKRKR